jgi:hypothetical protein
LRRGVRVRVGRSGRQAYKDEPGAVCGHPGLDSTSSLIYLVHTVDPKLEDPRDDFFASISQKKKSVGSSKEFDLANS